MKQLINQILALILGYRYHAIILRDRGVERYWISSYIYADTPADLKQMKEKIQEIRDEVLAHTYVQTITFRSRREYGAILRQRLQQSGPQPPANNLRRYTPSKSQTP